MVHWDFLAQPSPELVVNGLKNRKFRQLQVDTKATLICKDSPKLDKWQIKNMPGLMSLNICYNIQMIGSNLA